MQQLSTQDAPANGESRLTVKGQNTTEATITEQMVAALTHAWAAIQDRHADVPDVVLTIGSGTMGRTPRHGHFAAGRWQRGDTQLAELFVAGESFQRGAGPTLGTLLHEAAHGVCDTLGITDTSRGGKYHNKRFKTQAEAMGLVIEHDRTAGYSITTLPPTTADKYAEVLAELDQAITTYRHTELHATGTAKTSNYVKAECTCPRTIRVGKTVLSEAPITCGQCGSDFQAEDTDDEE
jgi:hypothetical protein